MSLPLIIICGQAGSGKDTVASFLVKDHGATAVALADPMKRLAQQVFAFSEEQLWGPSELRNGVVTWLGKPWEMDDAWHRLDSMALSYVQDLLGPGADVNAAREQLLVWFEGIWRHVREHGGVSPRMVLQTLGTEWGRHVSKNVWIDYGKRTALELLGGGYRYERTQGLIRDDAKTTDYVVITDGRFRNEIVSVLAMGGEAWRIVTPGVDGGAAEKAGIVGHASETEQRSIPNHFFTVLFENDKSQGLDACCDRVRDVMKQRPLIQLSNIS